MMMPIVLIRLIFLDRGYRTQIENLLSSKMKEFEELLSGFYFFYSPGYLVGLL
jgi:hypothetical protein